MSVNPESGLTPEEEAIARDMVRKFQADVTELWKRMLRTLPLENPNLANTIMQTAAFNQFEGVVAQRMAFGCCEAHTGDAAIYQICGETAFRIIQKRDQLRSLLNSEEGLAKLSAAQADILGAGEPHGRA